MWMRTCTAGCSPQPHPAPSLLCKCPLQKDSLKAIQHEYKAASYQQARLYGGQRQSSARILWLGSSSTGGRALQAEAQLILEALGGGVEDVGKVGGEIQHVGHQADVLAQPVGSGQGHGWVSMAGDG